MGGRKMKKIYVSLPISGYYLEERKDYARLVEKYLVENMPKPLIVITPFTVCPEADKSYSYYMGKDIEALLECDAVYFCKGWQNSDGCMLEFAAAKIYKKEIRFV